MFGMNDGIIEIIFSLVICKFTNEIIVIVDEGCLKVRSIFLDIVMVNMFFGDINYIWDENMIENNTIVNKTVEI